MFTIFIFYSITNLQNIFQKFLSHLLIVYLLFICLSQSSSISTFNKNLSSTNQWQFIANNTYRNFLLRQYFIDLLNISHTSIVRSMIYNHHLTTRSIRSIFNYNNNNNEKHLCSFIF